MKNVLNIVRHRSSKKPYKDTYVDPTCLSSRLWIHSEITIHLIIWTDSRQKFQKTLQRYLRGSQLICQARFESFQKLQSLILFGRTYVAKNLTKFPISNLPEKTKLSLVTLLEKKKPRNFMEKLISEEFNTCLTIMPKLYPLDLQIIFAKL